MKTEIEWLQDFKKIILNCMNLGVGYKDLFMDDIDERIREITALTGVDKNG